MKTEKKADMHCVADLDWVTFRCPCGAEFCTRGRYQETEAWLAEHKPHTTGMCSDTVTERGLTPFAEGLHEELKHRRWAL